MSKKIGTKCIHSGGITDDKFHGNITPIYPSITYDYLKSDAYPRYFNTPNQLSVKKNCRTRGAECCSIRFRVSLSSNFYVFFIKFWKSCNITEIFVWGNN